MENFAKHLEIENANSCKQGFAPFHTSNPHHNILVKYGWEYSHTTPICTVGGTYYAHHTYRFPGTDWCVGVSCRPGWAATSSRLGSGRQTTFFTNGLRKYLPRKTRELLKGAK